MWQIATASALKHARGSGGQQGEASSQHRLDLALFRAAVSRHGTLYGQGAVLAIGMPPGQLSESCTLHLSHFGTLFEVGR